MIDEKKLIEELKEYAHLSAGDSVNTIKVAIKIVEEQSKVGEWIPCSERLPDKETCEDESTDEDGLVTVETTEILPNGEPATFIEDYMIDKGEFCTPYKVIAWRERPEPYHPEEVIKQTNADRIRSMTDEELKELFMLNIPCDLDENRYNDYCCGRTLDCEKCIMDWLQSEVEESDER